MGQAEDGQASGSVPEAVLASPEGSRAGQKGPTSHPSGSRGSEGASQRLALTGSERRETWRAVVGSGSVRHKRPQTSAANSKRWWGEWVTDSGFPRAPQGCRTHPSSACPPAPVWPTVASGVSALQRQIARLRPSERRGPRHTGAQSRTPISAPHLPCRPAPASSPSLSHCRGPGGQRPPSG